MKILLDNFIFDLQYAGGISKVWYNILLGTKKCSTCTVTIFESDNSKNLFRGELTMKGFDIIMERRAPLLLRKFKRVDNLGSDIYHSSYFRPLKAKSSTKVVVTVHDFIYEKYAGALARYIHLYFKNRALKQADAVICVSHHTREDFLKYYPKFPKNQVYVVHNGVDDLFRPLNVSNNSLLVEFGLDVNTFLLYVGNRGYAKNFDFIWKLLKSKNFIESNLKLVCVGGGSVTKAEQRRIEELELVDRIVFLKDITSFQLNILYNYAFLLLFPSIYEGFGIPVLEAMRAGCPIWSTNSSSVKELLGPDYPVSFSPHSWEEALTAFVRLSSKDLREKARQIGLVQSLNFSWEKCAKQTLEVYRKSLNDE